MKNVSYLILGFIIGAVLTYYFCPRQLEEPITRIVKPKGVISQEQAKLLNEEGTMYRKAAVDSAAQKQGRKEDDRSTYWTLEDIENYLVYAKNQSDSLGYTMTGIRVYLGVYGKNADEPAVQCGGSDSRRGSGIYTDPGPVPGSGHPGL